MVLGATFGCIIANQCQNLIKGDRFFFTHKENGIRKERGWSMDEKKISEIHSRKLSDIMCDNMDFESIPQNIFQSNSDMMSCNEKRKLRLSRTGNYIFYYFNLLQINMDHGVPQAPLPLDLDRQYACMAQPLPSLFVFFVLSRMLHPSLTDSKS